MTIKTSIYGGYIDNIFYASANEVKLSGSLYDINLLSGSHIIINNVVEASDIMLFGDIIGECKHANSNIKNKIQAHIRGVIESQTPTNLTELFNTIGDDYTIEQDEAYTTYITPNGNYCIANTPTLQTWQVEMFLTHIVITPYVKDGLVDNGVYSFVKNTIDNISWEMMGRSISNTLSELYTIPDYVRKGINPTLLYKGPDALNTNRSPTLSEQENIQRIKARMVDDYDKYHYYLFKIPTYNLSRENIIRIYNSYSRTYYIDVLQYDGDILGLYVIGKR